MANVTNTAALQTLYDKAIAGANTVTTDVTGLNSAGVVTATQFNLSALNATPATAGATGVLGEIRFDAGFIYVCVATNTWKKVAIATW